MGLRNTENWYGGFTRLLHWLIALLVFGLFGLGLWMRQLTYYDPLYQVLPYIHKSFGIILLVLVIVRIFWRMTNVTPHKLPATRLEHLGAHVAHKLLYLLMIGLVVSGYIYATGDGKPIEIFNIMTLQSYISNKPLADQAGEIHEWLAYAIIAVAAVHAAGALKHHIIDKDNTLRRMVRREPK